MSINKIALYVLTEHPMDAARSLEQFEPEQLADYLDALPINTVAEILKFMVPSIAVGALKGMPVDKSSKIVMQLGVERGALLLQRMNGSIRLNFISRMSPVFANMMRLVLRYPVGTVGQAMNPNVLTVQEDLSVGEVMRIIKNSAELLHNDIYIIDNKQHLTGQVPVRQLLVSSTDLKMKKIMKMPTHSLSARASVKSIKTIPNWNNHDNYPVVDRQGIFLGVMDRAALNKAMNISNEDRTEPELSGTAIEVAEIFWDACANMIVPNQTLPNRDKKHE
jgi:magnesium transporter